MGRCACHRVGGGGGIRELSRLLAKAEQERTPAVFRLDYHKLYISTQYCSDGIWGVRNARPSPPSWMTESILMQT